MIGIKTTRNNNYSKINVIPFFVRSANKRYIYYSIKWEDDYFIRCAVEEKLSK